MIICPACKEQIEDDSHYCDQCGQQLLFCKQCGHVGMGRRCTRCGGVMALPKGSMDSAFGQQQEPSISVAPAQPVARPTVPPVAPISIISSPSSHSNQASPASPSTPVNPVNPANPAGSAGPANPASAPSPDGSSKASHMAGVMASISIGPSVSISQAGTARTGMPMMTLVNESMNLRINAMNGAIIGRRKGPYVQFFEQHSYVSGIHAQLRYKSDIGWCVIDKNSSNGTRVNQNPIQPEVETALKNGDVLTIANINLQVIIR